MTEKGLSATATPTLLLDAIDPQRLLLEDRLRSARPHEPLRFALPADVHVSPGDPNSWERLSDGWLWRLKVEAPGSTDLNFGFGRYRLPAGATLHVLGSEEYYQGPYTESDNRDHGQLWTPVIPGAQGIIELFVPFNVAVEPELELVRVGRGYRDLFDREQFFLKQGKCNIDVICPLGDDWRAEIRSVARISIDGEKLCSGTLINNLEGDFIPFFLTANSCGITPGNAATVVAFWNYEAPVCGELSGGYLTDTTSGATWRASNYSNDMSLIELDSIPDARYNVYYAGWDARISTTPQSGICIHHPSGDEKAISYTGDPLTTIDSCVGTGGKLTHWKVESWEDGTTEKGSTGSGLWDPSTHMLVGYLSGGLASCELQSFDCFGKFSVAWDAGLSQYLDPNGTGIRYLAGSDPIASNIAELINDQSLTGISGNLGEWLKYRIEVPPGVSNLVMEISGSYGDADLYTKFGSPPTLSSYDCRPYSGTSTETCVVPSPSEGYYYIYVYGYSSFSGLTIKAGYSDGKDVLQFEAPVFDLSATAGDWLRYRVVVPPVTDQLNISISGDSGDADLFVKYGSPPTPSSYDCRPYSSTSNEECHFPNPTSGTYYIGLNAYQSFYGLSLLASTEDVKILEDNVVVILPDANPDTWVFYGILIPPDASELSISIGGGRGDADLYARFAGVPSSSLWDCRQISPTSTETCSFPSPSSGIYYVGLYAYSSYSGVTLVATWIP